MSRHGKKLQEQAELALRITEQQQRNESILETQKVMT